MLIRMLKCKNYMRYIGVGGEIKNYIATAFKKNLSGYIHTYGFLCAGSYWFPGAHAYGLE